MDTWHNRLEIALEARGKRLRDLIAVTGKSAPSVYAWASDANRRTKMLDLENAVKICGFLKINLEWLLYGTEPSGIKTIDITTTTPKVVLLSPDSQEPVTLASSHHQVVRKSERVTIRQFDAAGSMGTGIVLRDQPGVIQRWEVSKEWANKNIPSNSGIENLCIITGFGDSMKGAFNPGDPLIVDLGNRELNHDGMFFFRVDNDGFIKKLQRIPGQGIRAISVNQAYEAWTITKDMDFEIIGKVLKVWQGENF